MTCLLVLGFFASSSSSAFLSWLFACSRQIIFLLLLLTAYSQPVVPGGCLSVCLHTISTCPFSQRFPSFSTPPLFHFSSCRSVLETHHRGGAHTADCYKVKAPSPRALQPIREQISKAHTTASESMSPSRVFVRDGVVALIARIPKRNPAGTRLAVPGFNSLFACCLL